MQDDGLKQPDDEALFRRMQAGDKAAILMLYERHEASLYRFAVGMSGNRALAEEVTQEAFLQLMSPSTRFDVRRGSLEAYLYGVVRNLLRRARLHPVAPEPAEPAVVDDIVRAMIEDETVAALQTAVQDLPSGYREAIVLCDLEERSYEDAAELMGCPVGTVRSRVHRGRAILAGKLKYYQRVRVGNPGRVSA
jgi:RNA polymerase sigma-70 factor (ECF subfamily)